MNWETLGPEAAGALTEFLATDAKSVVLLSLGPAGEILDANPAFLELVPAWRRGDGCTAQDFLEPCDHGDEASPAPTGVTYRLKRGAVPGARIRGFRVPAGEGSLLIAERLQPASGEALHLISATTNELARLNREGQRKYRESKRAQTRLEERYKLLVESTEQGMVWFDVDGLILEANPAAMRILGVDDPVRASESLLEAVGKDGEPLARERHPVIHAVRTGQPQLGVVIGVGAGTTWILLDALPEPKPDEAAPRMVCATFSDITASRRAAASLAEAEKALHESLARWDFALEGAGNGVWDWNVVTGEVYYSPRWKETLGYEEHEIGTSLDERNQRIHPEDRECCRAEMDRHLGGETPVSSCEYRMLHKDGSYRWILGRAKVMERAPDGRPLRLIGTQTDITGNRQAEAEKARLQARLQQAQKMESLGLLAGGVAHDMNNVLGAILGLASAHRGTQPAGTSLHRSLDTMCKAAERGGKMVQSLLNFARQSPAELRALNLNEILRDETSLLERTTLATIRVQMDLQGDLHPMQGDAGALSHAIMNLCVNAADAMPGSGTLTLRTRNLDRGWIECVVEDTGTGMSREVLDKALDPFFTTKPAGKGTGLGLSMAYGTVMAHNGRMEIESVPGQGTRVELRFPTCELETPAAQPADASASRSSVDELDVLLVDDDEFVQESLQAIVRALGHRAHAAACGEEAITRLEAGLAPDLIILDMNMPGLGGQGTLPLLRGMNPNVPVLLSTGRADAPALALASTYPGVTLLQKPFGLAELRRQLEALGWS